MVAEPSLHDPFTTLYIDMAGSLGYAVFVNKLQRDLTAKTLLDLAKAITIAFVIGGFFPDSPIRLVQIIWAIVTAVIFYLGAMLLIGGEND